MNRILKKAIELASDMKSQDYCLCAIITDKKGNILSIGKNDYNKSHPTQAYYAEKVGMEYRIFLHAEIDALVHLPYGKKPYAIYIARTGNDGNPLLAKPCPICQLAIKDAGIERVVYTK